MKKAATQNRVYEVVRINMPTEYGDFELVGFDDQINRKTLFALVKGSWNIEDPVLLRMHSSCITGDIIGSLRCDCGPQLEAAMEMVQKEGAGLLLYIEQEGRGIGFLNKMKAYKLQEEGRDTVQANIELGFGADLRNYESAAEALRLLNVHKIRLMTNNPTKHKALESFGFDVVEKVALEMESNEYNETYLKTKRDKMGHDLFQLGLK